MTQMEGLRHFLSYQDTLSVYISCVQSQDRRGSSKSG
jgi:hypothetical protein